MIKRLVFAKRREDVELAAFRAEATRRATAAAAAAGVSRAVLHLTHDSGYRAHQPDFDAVLELCVDGRPAAPFEGFAEAASVGTLDTREVVIVDGPVAQSTLTMFAFLNRIPGTAASDFQAYWRGHHGPIAGRVPGMRRYVQNHALAEEYADGHEPRFDGIPQTWFDDLDALRASAGSEELARTRADEPNFMVSGRLPFVVCTPIALVGGIV